LDIFLLLTNPNGARNESIITLRIKSVEDIENVKPQNAEAYDRSSGLS
jgi:hypothetical protein